MLIKTFYNKTFDENESHPDFAKCFFLFVLFVVMTNAALIPFYISKYRKKYTIIPKISHA